MEKSISENGDGENKENTSFKNNTEAKDVECETDVTKEIVMDNEPLVENDLKEPPEEINFVIVHNKVKYDVTFDANKTVKDLKNHLMNLINIPESLQKIMIKGLARDVQTLKELDVKSGSKIMVVGSKLDQILALSSCAGNSDSVEDKGSSTSKEPLCRQKNHKKVLDKGKPDDVMVGIKNVKDPLPLMPLNGMLNKSGGKVRLTFKLEVDQLWISTKERTDKVTMSSIKSVVSEAIEGNEEYHVMGLQLGPTEASRYWVYWVPAQYVDSIKRAVLGTWML